MKTLAQNLDEQDLHIENLYNKLSDFSGSQDVKQKIIDNALLASPTSLHKKIEIKSTYKLHEYQGFYSVEENEDEYFRWTKNSFYFDLPIDRTRKRNFLLTFSSPNDMMNHITCYANGQEIATEIQEENNSLILKGIIPFENIATNTRVSFFLGSIDQEMNIENRDIYSIKFVKLKIK